MQLFTNTDPFFANNTHRYGFQGQEKDYACAERSRSKIKGEGNSINYKFRMHDPRIGRFFSLDPLAPSYPWNSPFAFGENRVIDGVEFEGLEYATYTILVVDGTVTAIDLKTDYDLENKGSLGPGILYKYIHVNSFTNSIENKDELIVNSYGIYQGNKNPQLPKIGGSPNNKEYSYDLEPIDEADANAKQHDLDYDKFGLEGFFGVLDDNSTNANMEYNDRAKELHKNYVLGKRDKVTGKKISLDAFTNSIAGQFFFEIMELFKNNDDSNQNNSNSGDEDENKKP